jgi:hypothetical protein
MNRDWSTKDPLDALRGVEEFLPPPGAEERVAALLATGVSAPLRGAGERGIPAGSHGSTLFRLARRFAGWSLLPLAAGIAIGMAGSHVLSVRKARQSVAPVTSAVSPPINEKPEEPAALAPLSSVARTRSDDIPDGPTKRSSSRLDASEELARERGILDRARKRIAIAEPQQALALLNEHARRFPQGRLSEEREAMLVNVLVALGRREEARARGESFRRHFPNSLVRASVDAALATIPAN